MTAGTRMAELFLNRELSWLAFDARVVEEAGDPSVPLLERVKFAAISVSNLDEFFMVRVAGLKRAVDRGDTRPDLAGLTPRDQLVRVREGARALLTRIYDLVGATLRPGLATHGIRILGWDSLDAARQAGVTAYFRDTVLPVLTPLAIDVTRPFPLLASLSVNLAVRLDRSTAEGPLRLAVVQLPAGLARLVPIAAETGETFVLLEDVIRAHLALLFPGQVILESRVIRLARDAELAFDDEGGTTHLDIVARELHRRRRSDIVRLEIEADASPDLVALLSEQLEIEADEVYALPAPLDLRVLMGLTELPGFDALRDAPFQPRQPFVPMPDFFAELDRGDVLLHHPYDAYDPVLAFIAQAAGDPDVLAIKQTLYRVSPASPLIATLQRAAESGKQVTVLVELTARFDEERNIRWARSLEAAGAHVIYGLRGLKTHAKVCLVVRRTPYGIRRYVHLATGNYNDRTARLYTDFGLLTASREICDDASAVFNTLTGYSDPPRLRKLVLAPAGLRQRFLALIRREQRFAEGGQQAEITAKMNALIDEEIMLALVAASRAGVRIRLNVRGICALRPGIPGQTDRIDIVSVVDRFLEHSRIYAFHNGGDEEVFLASADWMSRNLDRRIELMFPVEDDRHRAAVLDVLRAMFRDTEKARWLQPDGTYRRGRPANPPFRVQAALMEAATRLAQAPTPVPAFEPELPATRSMRR